MGQNEEGRSTIVTSCSYNSIIVTSPLLLSKISQSSKYGCSSVPVPKRTVSFFTLLLVNHWNVHHLFFSLPWALLLFYFSLNQSSNSCCHQQNYYYIMGNCQVNLPLCYIGTAAGCDSICLCCYCVGDDKKCHGGNSIGPPGLDLHPPEEYGIGDITTPCDTDSDCSGGTLCFDTAQLGLGSWCVDPTKADLKKLRDDVRRYTPQQGQLALSTFSMTGEAFQMAQPAFMNDVSEGSAKPSFNVGGTAIAALLVAAAFFTLKKNKKFRDVASRFSPVGKEDYEEIETEVTPLSNGEEPKDYLKV